MRVVQLLLMVKVAYGKTFNLAVRDSDQRVLCASATSEASQTMPISDLPANSMPAPVKCAQHCTAHPSVCHSFNYLSDSKMCQFYHYQPTACEVVQNCRYYHVS